MTVRNNIRVLDNNVLMRDQTVNAVVTAFPPVVRSPVIKQEGSTLFEGQLAGGSARVVKFGYCFNGFTF